MDIYNQLEVKACTDLLIQNSAKLNLAFLQSLNLLELQELHETLDFLSKHDKLASLTKQELHQVIGENNALYFYHDEFCDSLLFNQCQSPLTKQNKLGKGKYGEVFLFASSSQKAAVKSALVKQSHFEHEHEMTQKAGVDSHYFFAQSNERLVTPYIKGKNLIFYLRNNKLTISQWLQLSLNLASEIINLHGNGVVHNDITPFNIRVDKLLNVSLIDYGESLNDMSLKAVDIYAYSQILIKKFTLLQKKSPSINLERIINMLDLCLDKPNQVSLNNIIEAMQEIHTEPSPYYTLKPQS